MLPLHNQRILLGISGGIASYKSAILARRLIDAGAEIRVVMTAGAQAFITPLTLQALTGNPVHIDLLDPAAEAAMGHIELARWADQIIIAPASANLLARLSHGLADDLLTTLCLASDAPLTVVPAMNHVMWLNSATQANCQMLAQRGVIFLGPDTGAQACGETGAGRMLEPETIRDLLIERSELTQTIHQSLSGLDIVLTAGPTVEPIDPVRFISNRSSGKMGFALAAAAAQQQAKVTLICGPVSLDTPPNVTRIDVDTAESMQAAVLSTVNTADVFIGVAAVADYRVADIAVQKIKKSDHSMNLQLVRNPDILSAVANLPNRPFCVGFAAETQSLEDNARSKLLNKKLDMIAANQVAQVDNPVFGSDTNALDVFWGSDGHHHISTGPKTQIAANLLDLIAQRLFVEQGKQP